MDYQVYTSRAWHRRHDGAEGQSHLRDQIEVTKFIPIESLKELPPVLEVQLETGLVGLRSSAIPFWVEAVEADLAAQGMPPFTGSPRAREPPTTPRSISQAVAARACRG